MNAPESRAPSGASHRCNGFDYLRLFLALGVVAFHSYTLSTGSITGMVWPAQIAARLLLPAFFALSGYLVSGSLARAPSLSVFLSLRLLRLGPGLGAVVTLSVMVLGPLLGRLPVADYFFAAQTWRYFANLIGRSQFFLPGLFVGDPRSGVVNGSLWTIPLEMECYLALALAAFLFRGRARLAALAFCAAVLFVPAAGRMFAAPELLLAFTCGAILHHGRVHALPAWSFAVFLVAALWLAAAGQPLAVLPLACAVVTFGRLRLPVIRFDYSYGLYLVGFPVEQALLQRLPGLSWWGLLLLTLPAAGLLAAGLWHGIEYPVLRRKHRLLARVGLRLRPLFAVPAVARG